MRSNGLNDRNISGNRRKNYSADAKNANGDWLAAQVSKYSVEEIVDSTGMTPKAVQNIRRRKCKISHDNFVALCIDRPDFAAAFAEHIGLLRPGEAETAEAVTRLVNSIVRRQA